MLKVAATVCIFSTGASAQGLDGLRVMLDQPCEALVASVTTMRAGGEIASRDIASVFFVAGFIGGIASATVPGIWEDREITMDTYFKVFTQECRAGDSIGMAAVKVRRWLGQ